MTSQEFWALPTGALIREPNTRESNPAWHFYFVVMGINQQGLVVSTTNRSESKYFLIPLDCDEEEFSTLRRVA
jgi:hypothetical protein